MHVENSLPPQMMPKPKPKDSSRVKPGSKDIIRGATTALFQARARYQQAHKVFQTAEDAFKKTILAALAADDAEDVAE
jgi:hypothetical protein